jgi:hypothetical protein
MLLSPHMCSPTGLTLEKTNSIAAEAAQSAAQVLRHLQATRTRLLVAGDSMQKQLHGRIVHMFRGTRHPIDNRIFTVRAVPSMQPLLCCEVVRQHGGQY